MYLERVINLSIAIDANKESSRNIEKKCMNFRQGLNTITQSGLDATSHPYCLKNGFLRSVHYVNQKMYC